LLFVFWRCDAKQVVIFFGQITAFKLRDAAFFEKYDDPAAGNFPITFTDAEEIIPAGFMEQVGKQWGAEHKAYLFGRHAHFQLGHHLLGNEITLLNIGAVNRHYAKQL